MRKFLYVSYYFPPSGGPGVQRPLKLSRYLPASHWQPTIVTVDPDYAAYPSLDPTLLAEVPADLDVRRTRAWDPYAAYARLLGSEKKSVVSVGFVGEGKPGPKQLLARFIRANVFVPDARIGWVPFATRSLRRLAATGEYDLIFSTGPPHSTHLAARRVARQFDLPWVADFRDPWTEIYYYNELPALPPARALDRALERKVIEGADAVVVVTPSVQRRLDERGFVLQSELIPNGFDPEDFAGPAPAVDPTLIRHVGNLGPTQSLNALARVLSAMPTAPDGRRHDVPPFRVSFVGAVDPTVLAPFGGPDLADRCSVELTVPHEAAVARMRSAGILLLVVPHSPGAEAHVAGKLYEYFAAGRPVLGIGPTNGDAADLLREYGAGEMFNWDDAEGITSWLVRYAADVSEGFVPFGARAERVERFSRRGQAAHLAALFDRLMIERKARSRA